MAVGPFMQPMRISFTCEGAFVLSLCVVSCGLEEQPDKRVRAVQPNKIRVISFLYICIIDPFCNCHLITGAVFST